MLLVKCPNCDSHEFERLDVTIVMCTQCSSLFDPFVYPGFLKPDVKGGDLWDTTEDFSIDWEADA
jgi:hypothetical protein